MNVNQDFGPRIRSWLHQRLTERPDPYPILDEVLSQLPTTPQRRHRWWPFDHAAKPRVPATNGATSSRRFTMFSALKFVTAGIIVALFGGFLLTGILTAPQGDDVAPAAATESPEPSEPVVRADILPGVTLTVEEVEPGVERIISDGVGHDLDETHPTYRYDMDGIAIAPDGTAWLLTSYSDTDNEANPDSALVWALGQPGVFGVWQGVPGWGYLVLEADGTPLIIADWAFRLDGEAFVLDDGPMFRPLVGDIGLWLMEPADLMGLVPDGESAVQPRGILPAIWFGSEWGALSEMGLEVETLEHFCETFGVGVDCYGEDETTYLEGTNIYQLAAAPDGSIWAVGDYDGGGGGLYRITLQPAE